MKRFTQEGLDQLIAALAEQIGEVRAPQAATNAYSFGTPWPTPSAASRRTST